MGKSGIGSTLFGKSRLAILSLLLIDDTKRYYLRQVVNVTKLGVGAVQRELALLSGCGILTRAKEGNRVYFQANPACPVFRELKSLVVKTGGVAEVLLKLLAKFKKRIRFAFIYGSFADGKDDAGSDIDIMVVGSVTFADIIDAFGDVQMTLRREVNPTVYPEEEFIQKLKTPFLKNVIAKNKIFLVGDEDDIERLVG